MPARVRLCSQFRHSESGLDDAVARSCFLGRRPSPHHASLALPFHRAPLILVPQQLPCSMVQHSKACTYFMYGDRSPISSTELHPHACLMLPCRQCHCTRPRPTSSLPWSPTVAMMSERRCAHTITQGTHHERRKRSASDRGRQERSFQPGPILGTGFHERKNA